MKSFVLSFILGSAAPFSFGATAAKDSSSCAQYLAQRDAAVVLLEYIDQRGLSSTYVETSIYKGDLFPTLFVEDDDGIFEKIPPKSISALPPQVYEKLVQELTRNLYEGKDSWTLVLYDGWSTHRITVFHSGKVKEFQAGD